MRTFSLIFAVTALVLAVAGCTGRKEKPSELINLEASIPAGLPFNPLQGTVITSFVNQQDGTMSTLFGNDAAADHARKIADNAYPIGCILTLVTWTQKEDPHWFGARIPKQVKSVEIVTAQPSEGDATEYIYQIYLGRPLEEQNPDTLGNKARLDFILGLQASVMP